MPHAWTCYWIGFLVLILYGILPPMLSGNANLTINLVEGAEYDVKYFQLIKSPLNIYLSESRSSRGNNLDQDINNLNLILSIKIDGSNEFIYHLSNRNMYVGRDDFPPSVGFGRNVIHVKIVSFSSNFVDSYVKLNFYGPTSDIKHGYNPSWFMNVITLFSSIFWYLIFGLLAKTFTRFVLK